MYIHLDYNCITFPVHLDWSCNGLFLLLNEHYLSELSAVELVNVVLPYRSSSHKVRRDLSLVNISAVLVPDGIVWDKVSYVIFGPTETLQIPYVFRISLQDVITSSTISNDWDIDTAHEILDDLKHSTVFNTEEMYDSSSNYDEIVGGWLST